jgi:3-hydroxymyristoyl/3-hydroxydecanoyl-(acyl carrier protein) dehydratase
MPERANLAPARGAIVPAGTATLCVPAAHPCLPGHFPGQPVVPGVLLLDALAVALAVPLAVPLAIPLAGAAPSARIARLARVKFAAPVLAEQTVLLRWEPMAPGRIAFTGTVAGAEVLSGQAELAPAAGGGAGEA